MNIEVPSPFLKKIANQIQKVQDELQNYSKKDLIIDSVLDKLKPIHNDINRHHGKTSSSFLKNIAGQVHQAYEELQKHKKKDTIIENILKNLKDIYNEINHEIDHNDDHTDPSSFLKEIGIQIQKTHDELQKHSKKDTIIDDVLKNLKIIVAEIHRHHGNPSSSFFKKIADQVHQAYEELQKHKKKDTIIENVLKNLKSIYEEILHHPNLKEL